MSSDRINENNLVSCLALKIHIGHKRKIDNYYTAIIKRCAHSKYRALKVLCSIGKYSHSQRKCFTLKVTCGRFSQQTKETEKGS